MFLEEERESCKAGCAWDPSPEVPGTPLGIEGPQKPGCPQSLGTLAVSRGLSQPPPSPAALPGGIGGTGSRTGPGRRRRGPGRAGRPRGGTCGGGAVPGLRPHRHRAPRGQLRAGGAAGAAAGEPRSPGGRREPGAAAAAPEPRARSILREKRRLSVGFPPQWKYEEPQFLAGFEPLVGTCPISSVKFGLII
ncbi:noncompact myelin-associated protein isoform X3 [Prinia subflava]|uniref:noncompact myelin-associated protein isoform X3 n=1 Tax=Prinia subflava TaxID=208062 RepID=UPI002FE2EDDB